MPRKSSEYAIDYFSVQFQQGRRAYRDGLPSESNPYRSGATDAFSTSRQMWFEGWYSEQRWRKYGPNEDEQCTPLKESGHGA